MSFKIRMIKPVTVRDLEGTTLRVYEIGEVLEATHDAGRYWIAGPGIYKDEAERLPDPIDERFIQLGEDWA